MLWSYGCSVSCTKLSNHWFSCRSILPDALLATQPTSSRKWCKIEVESETIPELQMVPLLMTLRDPTPSFKVIQYFEDKYLANVTSREFVSDSRGFLLVAMNSL